MKAQAFLDNCGRVPGPPLPKIYEWLYQKSWFSVYQCPASDLHDKTFRSRYYNAESVSLELRWKSIATLSSTEVRLTCLIWAGSQRNEQLAEAENFQSMSVIASGWQHSLFSTQNRVHSTLITGLQPTVKHEWDSTSLWEPTKKQWKADSLNTNYEDRKHACSEKVLASEGDCRPLRASQQSYIKKRINDEAAAEVEGPFWVFSARLRKHFRISSSRNNRV